MCHTGARGARALLLLPSIPDDLDPTTKSALVIRNAASAEGRCPVSVAVREIHPDREQPGLWHLVFEHDDHCPALRDDPDWTCGWRDRTEGA
jgi:hypothetical protein